MGQSHFIEQTPYRELLSYRLKISRYRKIVTFDRKRWYSRDSCILSIFLSVSTPRNFWRILFVRISMRNKDNNKIVEINRKRRIMKKKKQLKIKFSFRISIIRSVHSFTIIFSREIFLVKNRRKNARTAKELEARSLDFWNTSPALFCSYRAMNC